MPIRLAIFVNLYTVKIYYKIYFIYYLLVSYSRIPIHIWVISVGLPRKYLDNSLIDYEFIFTKTLKNVNCCNSKIIPNSSQQCAPGT